MRLSGGEPVTARGMRQDFITFPGTHKLFVVANTAPTLRGGREPAWQRRLHMILFQQRWAATRMHLQSTFGSRMRAYATTPSRGAGGASQAGSRMR